MGAWATSTGPVMRAEDEDEECGFVHGNVEEVRAIKGGSGGEVVEGGGGGDGRGGNRGIGGGEGEAVAVGSNARLVTLRQEVGKKLSRY